MGAKKKHRAGAAFAVGVACCALALFAAAPAGAAPAWLAPVDLSAAGQDAGNPQVAVDPQGNAVAVWDRYSGTHYIVQGATRPAGGAWQTPVDLSAAGNDATGAQVAVDPQGNAIAVWYAFNGTNNIVQAATRAAGGAWQTPVSLSASGQDATGPQVAVDSQGNAVAVWDSSNGTNLIVQGATRAAGGAWQTPVNLSAAGQDAFGAQIAVGPQGDAVAVWDRSNGANYIAQGAPRPAGGAWQTPVTLSTAGQNATGPRVAVDSQGNAIAVWDRSNGTNTIVQTATRPAGGAWQTPVNLSAAGQNANYPQIAFDPQGNAVAVWYRSNGTKDIVQGEGYDAAGPLLRATSIPTAGTAGQPLSFSVSPLDVWSALGPTNWGFGDGAGASGATVTHAYAGAGSYRVTLTSADALGNTTSASGMIAIAPASLSALRPPTISGASVTNQRFRVARQDTAISAKTRKQPPRGTTFRFTLSAAAKLQIAITRAAPGLRHGHNCVAPTARLRRKHAKRCTRTLTVGTLTRASEPQGPDSVPFSGRIGHRALPPAAYTASLSASNTAGHSMTVKLAFAVVR